MERRDDPLPETEGGESARDRPAEPVLITVDEFYDLLMEQQVKPIYGSGCHRQMR